ncbi:uncharacterized protein BXZ73DRAFT_79469 [Epithele typhae]|uniref:uncharacterized protein n=1 Tax=Epithele typhae TaxID=378194 RepID=UPI002007B7BF|nr:uncharacterized protein BXZ73DRAFT_79469 [Epithele typhae]KAH9923398.1 hypothetical protein BXZ73DRAFT_79469 [Epithele typhae]
MSSSLNILSLGSPFPVHAKLQDHNHVPSQARLSSEYMPFAAPSTATMFLIARVWKEYHLEPRTRFNPPVTSVKRVKGSGADVKTNPERSQSRVSRSLNRLSESYSSTPHSGFWKRICSPVTSQIRLRIVVSGVTSPYGPRSGAAYNIASGTASPSSPSPSPSSAPASPLATNRAARFPAGGNTAHSRERWPPRTTVAGAPLTMPSQYGPSGRSAFGSRTCIETGAPRSSVPSASSEEDAGEDALEHGRTNASATHVCPTSSRCVIGSGASGVEAVETALAKGATGCVMLTRNDKARVAQLIIPRNIVVDTLISAQPFGREMPLSFLWELSIACWSYGGASELVPTRLDIVNIGHAACQGWAMRIQGDVVVFATGFKKPEVDFFKDNLFPESHDRPDLYLQNFSTEESSVLMEPTFPEDVGRGCFLEPLIVLQAFKKHAIHGASPRGPRSDPLAPLLVAQTDTRAAMGWGLVGFHWAVTTGEGVLADDEEVINANQRTLLLEPTDVANNCFPVVLAALTYKRSGDRRVTGLKRNKFKGNLLPGGLWAAAYEIAAEQP